MRRNNLLKMLLILTIAGGMALAANGQESGVRAGSGIVAPAAPARAPSSAGAVRLDSYSQFVDEVNGATPDDLIRYAFQHNGELAAARQMIAEAEGRLNQAGLKANPMVESNYQQGVTSADNNFTIGAELPLEPGRRAARVAVATSELELARAETADFERKLTAEVRARLAEVLAAARNLKFSEELLGLDQDSHRLVHALVELGKRAPLEESTLLVEVNRADAMRAANLGRAESALFELKKTIGMPRDEPLRLHDEFARDFQPARQADLVRDALLLRPDLQAARAAEKLAKARVEQARVEGRIDASIFANYQRMATSFDQRGFNSQGLLVPVAGIFHFASFGVRLALPVRNKNQGAVEAALAAAEGARQTEQFAENAILNEVASACVRFEQARKARTLYHDGVLEPATRNLDVIRQTYAFGQKTLLDYLTEQRRYADLEADYTNVLKEYFDAMAAIQTATGTEVH